MKGVTMARYRIRAEVVVDGDQSQWITLDEDGKPSPAPPERNHDRAKASNAAAAGMVRLAVPTKPG